jgi:hypothetical protein
MDHTAKGTLWGLEGGELPPQGVFPLEPIAVFAGKEKLTSGSEDWLRFWCQRQVAKEVLAHEKVGVLQPDQFEEVEWQAVYQALTEVPRMFQLWACKQMTGVAGTNEMQARYTPNHSRKCPSCGVCVEDCAHVLFCEEEGRVDLLQKSIDLVEQWMKDKGTDNTLRKYLVKYARARGGRSMLEIVGWFNAPYQKLANSMDRIGWRRFMEGMISKEAVEIQRRAEDAGKCTMTVNNWSAGLVTKLLEVTHGQWLYRNVHVHDALTGEKVMMRKAAIRREVEFQIALGGEGLAAEDQYLLEINLEDLDNSRGEDHIYWLMALKTARKAWQIREARRTASDSGGH